MGCTLYPQCGGCFFRDLDQLSYQKQKEFSVFQTLEKRLDNIQHIWQPPIFLADSTRRRAALTFSFKKQKLLFGFNSFRSNDIIDIEICFMLSSGIASLIPSIREFLLKLCSVISSKRIKGKKVINEQIQSGDLLILEAENGIDIVLETATDLVLDHRLIINELLQEKPEIIRFSWRKKHCQNAEPILERAKPFIKIGKTEVFIPAGEFLQPSKQGEQALLDLVVKYVGTTRGQIADLFCGIGTFSYKLSELENVRITAIDISDHLLTGFQKSINVNMIQNISVKKQNLFLYPLDHTQLSEFDIVIFDPPRAGALATVKELSKIDFNSRPKKIIAVSCCPETFVRDAFVLVSAGYSLKSITMVDQFVYSNHSELVALFTNEK